MMTLIAPMMMIIMMKMREVDHRDALVGDMHDYRVITLMSLMKRMMMLRIGEQVDQRYYYAVHSLTIHSVTAQLVLMLLH
jgi:hypothetical protein